MIRLKNIKIDESVVEADIYPEDSSKAGHIVVDIKTKEHKYILPEGYEWCKNHASHAAEWILKNSEKTLPEEKLLMWL